MPITAVDEHQGAVLRKHQIGPAGEVPVAQSVAKSESMQTDAQNPLRLGVGAANLGHGLGALLFGQSVGHRLLETN